MADMNLYPENLKGLDLTFAESIYVIAFKLENEIRAQGKEAIFKELGMTATEMAERVEHCLNEEISKSNAYVLRRVLGDLDSAVNDKETLRLSERWSLNDAFDEAVRALQSSIDANYGISRAKNYRKLLTIGRKSQFCGETAPRDVNDLYGQVQQLMNEVRMYDKKRDQALARIETLMVQIQQREDCPRNFGKTQSEPASHTIDVDGPITQILWPYRSSNVLQKLRLTTMKEAVNYFQDFQHFVEGESITLMEWLVVTSILRKEDLLPTVEDDVVELDDEIGVIDWSVRTYNCLTRRGIEYVEDLVKIFAGGAREGWGDLRRTRNLGTKSYYEIVRKMGEITIRLNDSLCFSTPESNVKALDFDDQYSSRLSYYNLNTIAELLEACHDTNRFSGLRYVDNSLYHIAMRRLEEYGYN